ncbi:hypothetical protein [Bacillus sp. SJS]|uniref:hypothetical protein n=1 Tax=Bacillus sp. SJS TaxID=1423321 RepID=UPI0004DCB6DC|nr:hypothetical protein [Bacillus sp. SJS]KZZ85642.1 hypothetical protein AS29_003375 [Bacillus sp. SJS]
MTFEEIARITNWNENEDKLFMPNEIFDDLKESDFTSSAHIYFAYAYIYLITWLFRYAKYGQFEISVKTIKQILGYKPNYEKIDYIIKKNGLLDQMGYTMTVSDYPLSWTYKKYENDEIEFYMVSDVDPDDKETVLYGKRRNIKIKFPVKHFHRDAEAYEEGHPNGVFYDVEKTHMIPSEVFLFSMSKSEIGCTGFFLYSYLKSKNQIFKSGYDVSLTNLAKETGLKPRTLDKYLDALKKHRMILCIVNQEFVIGLKESERLANTYITKDYIAFSDTEQTYIKRKVTNEKAFYKKKEESLLQDAMVEDALQGLPSNF